MKRTNLLATFVALSVLTLIGFADKAKAQSCNNSANKTVSGAVADANVYTTGVTLYFYADRSGVPTLIGQTTTTKDTTYVINLTDANACEQITVVPQYNGQTYFSPSARLTYLGYTTPPFPGYEKSKCG